MTAGYTVEDLDIVEHCLTVVMREVVEANMSGRLTEVEKVQTQKVLIRVGQELQAIERHRNLLLEVPGTGEIEGQTNIYDHLGEKESG